MTIEQIKQKLKDHNISQAQFGRDMNMSAPSVSRHLNGKDNFSKIAMAGVVHYFNFIEAVKLIEKLGKEIETTQ